MLFKPVPRKDNIIRRPAYIAFLKNDKFSGYTKVLVGCAILWAFLSFMSGGAFRAIFFLLFIASLGVTFIIPKMKKKSEKDQFVIEYQFGIHDVTDNLQKKIPWSHIVCFANSYQLADKKSGTYESTFYIVTPNEHIKIDSQSFTEEQMQEIYNLLGPYLNSYQRYIAGENLVTVEVRDINKIRQQFMGQQLYIQ